MSKQAKILIGVIFGTLLLAFAVFLSVLIKPVEAGSCKNENAECQWNHSQHNCCPGLDCNFWKEDRGHDKYKCEATVSPSPSPSVSPSPSPSPSPSVSPEPSSSPEPSDSPEPSSSPEPSKSPEPSVEPSPTPTPIPGTPEGPKEPGYTNNPGGAPQCQDGMVLQLPGNAHVVRSGSSAIVNWFNTGGNSANIYYKEVGEGNWKYSVLDIDTTGRLDNFVSVTINDLNPSLGYTFGIQQKANCGGGELVTAVIVDGSESKVFPLSYWIW